MVDQPPALLVAYQQLAAFQRHRATMFHRDWVLDSGAFSALYTDDRVVLEEYVESIQKEMAGPNPPATVFALDVIGDPDATFKNAVRMRKLLGFEAVPCFHSGERLSHLDRLAGEFDRLALGGVAKARVTFKRAFARECLRRVWPKWVHGFGYGNPSVVLVAPFASVDASSWIVSAQKYGKWNMLDGHGAQVWLRTKAMSDATYCTQVEFFIDLERQMSATWRRHLDEIGVKRAAARLVVTGKNSGLDAAFWKRDEARGCYMTARQQPRSASA